MARPRKNTFFEISLSDPLSDSEKWLPLYHKCSEQLAHYMKKQSAGTTAYRSTINCLTKLRAFLLENQIPYSDEAALQWLSDTGPYPKGYKITITRLNDIYIYGEVQTVNMFPQIFSYEKCLTEPWKGILNDFLHSRAVSENPSERMKINVSRFLYYLQKNGLSSASEITFDTLETYFTTEKHVSEQSARRYYYAAGHILLFMADKDMCSRGLGWYPYFRMYDHVIRMEDMSDLQISMLKQEGSDSQELSPKNFAALIPAFLKEYGDTGYSETPCSVAHFTLYNLLLFLEMYGFGYSKSVADAWLEREKVYHVSEGWEMPRRVLHLFDLYVEKGRVIPEVIFREKPLLCEKLPEWCRAELQGYLEIRRKEGCQESALVMIRSSVTRFCRYLTGEGIRSFEDLSLEMLKNFNISDPHDSVEGKNAYNVRIRMFLRYLERKNRIPYGMHLALSAVAARKEKVVVVLTEEEKLTIKAKYKNSTDPLDLRDHAMLKIGIGMGLRASDIVKIRLNDINWKDQTLHVIQEKTDHEILLPIPTDVANAIYLYIKAGRPNGKTGSDYLFLKNRVPYNALCRNICGDALKRGLPSRNIPGSGFHVTRKTYATDRLRNGTGRQMLADLLGHRDTGSLDHYLLLDEERMRMCPISLEESGLALKGDRYDRI